MWASVCPYAWAGVPSPAAGLAASSSSTLVRAPPVGAEPAQRPRLAAHPTLAVHAGLPTVALKRPLGQGCKPGQHRGWGSLACHSMMHLDDAAAYAWLRRGKCWQGAGTTVVLAGCWQSKLRRHRLAALVLAAFWQSQLCRHRLAALALAGCWRQRCCSGAGSQSGLSRHRTLHEVDPEPPAYLPAGHSCMHGRQC